MNLLVISVTYHTPQNRVSDIIMHVTLNTKNTKNSVVDQDNIVALKL
jgi:hypothetical protein